MDKSKLQGLWSNDGSIITPASHGEYPQEGPETDPWGGLWIRGGGYVCGAIPMYPELNNMPGGGVSRKVTQIGSDPRKCHVQELEGHDYHPAVGTRITPVV